MRMQTDTSSMPHKRFSPQGGWASFVKKWLIRLSLGFFALSLLGTLLFAVVPVPFTPLMLQRCLGHIASGRSPKLHKDWVPIEAISEGMILAVVCAEDQKFMEHNGLDWDAIEKARKDNERRKKQGKPIRGASTISQQCAKNVFLFPARTWVRKGFEVYFTLLIETIWSKERIMEVYLNVIEVGDGIYGVQAAAQDYFHKDASALTNSEGAAIAAVLPNPREFSVINPGAGARKHKAQIFRQMKHFGNIELSPEDEAETSQAPEPKRPPRKR